MKPVLQFPIPPLHPPVLKATSSSSTSLSAMNDGRDEPLPKRMRLDDSDNSSSSFSDHNNHNNNNEAQNSNNFNINFGMFNAQEPQAVVFHHQISTA